MDEILTAILDEWHIEEGASDIDSCWQYKNDDEPWTCMATTWMIILATKTQNWTVSPISEHESANAIDEIKIV